MKIKCISKVANKISRVAGRTGLITKKYTPEMLVVVGVTGVAVATVMACKATLKVEEKLEDIDRDIQEARKQVEEENASEKEVTKAKIRGGVKLAKLYLPAVGLMTVSVGCIIGSHHILRKRNLALMAAYKALDTDFTNYRKRVIEDYGEEVDNELKTGIKQEKEEGSDESVSTMYDPNGISQYARFFDESSDRWSKTPEYNMIFLKAQQNYANDLLHARGHVFLNEVYDMLGLERSQAGAVTGWILNKEGDNFVDFGIYNIKKTANRDFVNGFESRILLDFNVDGVIYDLI